jgi:GNAT superfamily N-acetyltransferase
MGNPVTEPALASFFAGSLGLGAVIEAVVEGRLGQATVAGDAARLKVGCYEIFGGDPSSPSARTLVATAARPRELVYGNDPGWRQVILDVHGEEVSDRPMRDYDPSGIDPASLFRIEAELPAGFRLQALDSLLTRQLDADLEPHALQVFKSAQAFLEHGLGFGAVQNGQLVCAATSYTRSSRSVEVAIATRTTFRGRGLAAATAARLVRQCLTEGLTPRWSASNPVSQRLAVRLGYQPAGVCQVLYRGAVASPPHRPGPR